MDESGMSDLPEDETIEDEDGPTIEASAEMQEALREAAQAVEARKGEGGAGASAGSDDAGATPDKMTIELLSQELQDLKGLYEGKTKEFDEVQERHLRLQAEFENFRRRGLKEKQESLQFGHQNLVKDLLSAVDDLERALEHGAQKAGEEVKGILDGVELVHREVLAVLAKHGVSQIEAQGAVFDPAVHEAMGQLPSAEVPANTVLQVLQKGYLIRDRMLRPARVIVARAATAEEAAGGGEQA
jgi:molecular chaperone GrpE